MSTMLSVVAYRNNFVSEQQALKQEAFMAESIIAGVISEHRWQIRSIADKIMKVGSSLEMINKIISDQNKFDNKSNFDQFLNQKDLLWVDANDDVVIKNKVGILKFPQRVSKSYEVFNARENSWKLLISKELPSLQNDYSLILTSFGVTDSSGKYLGSIVSSIDIHLIQNLLIKSLPSKDHNFVILSAYDNKIVFQTDPENLIKNNEIFTHKFGNVDYSQVQENFLDENILVNDVEYNYYKKLSDYPLVVLSGHNYPIYRSNLAKIILKTIYPNIAVGFLLIGSLFLFYRRIVKPINDLSVIARKIGSNDHELDQKLPRKINSPEIFDLAKALLKIRFQRRKLEKSNLELTETKDRLVEAIDVIKKSDIAQIEIIKQIKKDISKNTTQVFQVLKMLKHNIENHVTQDGKLNLFLIKSLEQDIANITKFATDELNKDFADIQHVINRAALSQEKEIKLRNIKLEVIYDKNLPKQIFVDQIRLIQILSSILHKTIGLLSEENTVKIFVKIVIRNKKKNLSIRIEDDGMGIGFKEHISDARRFGGREESSVNGIDIAVETIEELVALHQGEVLYDNVIQRGSSTTIVLPCIKQIKNNPPALPQKLPDNVICFPIKNKDQ